MTMRGALPYLATGWALLWAALNMAEGGFKFGPNEAGIFFLIPAAGWLFGWLRANAVAPPAMDTHSEMIRAALGLVPILIIGALPIIADHMRHLAGGAQRHPAPAALRAVCFCLPWLLLFASRAWSERTVPALERVSVPPPPPAPLRPRAPASVMVPVGDIHRSVAWDTVLWLEADDNYVRVHTATRDYFVRRSLKDLLADAGDRFARIHKSRAVNRAEIAALRPLTNGDGEVHLRSGQTLRMSRRFRAHLSALLKP